MAEADGAGRGADHHGGIVLHIEIINFGAAGGVERAALQRVQNGIGVLFRPHPHKAAARLLGMVGIVGGHAVNHPALLQQLVPIGGAGVQLVFNGAARIPNLHQGKILQRRDFGGGVAAPLGMAENGQVAGLIHGIDDLLRVFPAIQLPGFKALILGEAVVRLGAHGNDMGAMHPGPFRVRHVAVQLHAGQNQQARLGGKILIIINAMSGKRKEIKAHGGVLADGSVGGALTVGAGGMGMHIALEHFAGSLKSRLMNTHEKRFLSSVPDAGGAPPPGNVLYFIAAAFSAPPPFRQKRAARRARRPAFPCPRPHSAAPRWAARSSRRKGTSYNRARRFRPR